MNHKINETALVNNSFDLYVYLQNDNGESTSTIDVESTKHLFLDRLYNYLYKYATQFVNDIINNDIVLKCYNQAITINLTNIPNLFVNCPNNYSAKELQHIWDIFNRRIPLSGIDYQHLLYRLSRNVSELNSNIKIQCYLQYTTTDYPEYDYHVVDPEMTFYVCNNRIVDSPYMI